MDKCANVPAKHAMHDEAPLPEIMPAEHCVQFATLVAPVKGRKVPARQPAHCDAPSVDEYRPAKHDVHVDSAVAPKAVLDFPSVHNVHVVVKPFDQVPATHRTQLVAASATPVEKPAEQARHDDAPFDGAYWFARHGEHVEDAVAPDAALNLPDVQLVHELVGVEAHLPGSHSVHTEAPVAALVYEPAGHDEHDEEPSAEYAPSGEHRVHEVTEVAPCVPRNVPAAHGSHMEAPALVEYRPAKHREHAVMVPFENEPTAHGVQVEAAVATPVALPAGHGEQEAEPVDAANCVAMQSTHVDAAVAPVAELDFPAAHAVHVPTVLAPVAVLYRPATQFVHTLVGEPAHLPGGHCVHVEALAAAFVYEPAVHDKQAEAATPEYVPRVEHGEHDAVEAPVVPRNEPAGQSVHTDAPVVVMKRPVAQGWHVDSVVAPVAALNFPAAHSVHNVVEPLDHAPVPHDEHVDAPVATPVKEPAGHAPHVVKPEVAVNWFDGHETQVDSALAPMAALALPAAHAVHVSTVLAPVAVL